METLLPSGELLAVVLLLIFVPSASGHICHLRLSLLLLNLVEESSALRSRRHKKQAVGNQSVQCFSVSA